LKSKYVLAVDQGTTTTKSILVDKQDRLCHVAQRVLSHIYPQPGWVEMDPSLLWNSIESTVHETIHGREGGSNTIGAVGLSNQGETIIPWDRETGDPLYNAITWQCNRTSKKCEKLSTIVDLDMIRSKTGLILDPYFSATKIQWLLESVEAVQDALNRKTLMVGTLDSWMIWRMSGGKVFVTDFSTASRTLLFNIRSLEWDEELLSLFHIPRWILPDPKPSACYLGETDPQAFLGLRVPITGSAVDQPAALFGQACFDRGDLKITYGTGAFMLMNLGSRFALSEHNLLTSIGANIEGENLQYYFDGGIYSVGASIQWLQETLKLIADPSETATMAGSLRDNEGVYFVPALVGLAAPYWNRKVKAGFLGLTAGTTPSHLVRAVLEAVAYRVFEVVKTMEKDAGAKIEQIKVDGGVTKNDFLMQFQADLLGVPLRRAMIGEMTALGAAHLAGLAIGFWPDKDTFRERLEVERVFSPCANNRELLVSFERWKRAVETAINFENP
jgi:glycerol kinase